MNAGMREEPRPNQRQFRLRTLLGVVTVWAIVLSLSMAMGPVWAGAMMFWTGAAVFPFAASQGRSCLMAASMLLSTLGILAASLFAPH